MPRRISFIFVLTACLLFAAGVTHEAQNSIAGTVCVEEPLGSDKFLTIDVEQSHVIVRTDPDFGADFGAPVHIHFNPDKVYLFDRKTGNAI